MVNMQDSNIIDCIFKVYTNGDKAWYFNGQLHREDGPAVECANGDKFWYLNGKLHRENNPAIEYANGDKFWYLNNIKFSEKEFNNQKNPPSSILMRLVQFFSRQTKNNVLDN